MLAAGNMHRGACAARAARKGPVHAHMHPGEQQGSKQRVVCLVSWPWEPGRSGREKPRLVCPEVLPPHAAPALHYQGPELTSPTVGPPLQPAFILGCRKFPPWHTPPWAAAWRMSPSPPPCGPCPTCLTPLPLTPIFFCLSFSLSVTYGCFCSAPHRHRKRAQLPLL